MGQVLVIYHSDSGNTANMAQYVAQQFTLHYGAVQAGEPRKDKEKEACRRLGRRLAQWVAVFIDGRKDILPVHEKLAE